MHLFRNNIETYRITNQCDKWQLYSNDSHTQMKTFSTIKELVKSITPKSDYNYQLVPSEYGRI